MKQKSNLTDGQKALLFNGNERPDKNDSVNYITLDNGGFIEYKFAEPVKGTARLVLDLDYSRNSVSDDGEYKRYSMQLQRPFSAEAIENAGKSREKGACFGNYFVRRRN